MNFALPARSIMIGVLVITAALTTALVQPVFAVSAPNGLQTFTQPDGRTFEGKVRGDEHLAWHETVSGSAVARGEDGFWYHVRSYQGRRPILSDRRADRPRPGNPDIRPIPDVPGDGLPFDEADLVPGALEPKVLFILVDYDDAPATFTSESQWANKIVDAVDPGGKSVVDYWDEASYGMVEMAPAEEGSGIDNNGVVGWLRLGPNHPNPAQYAIGTSPSVDAMNAIFSAAIAAADDDVDFASFDADEDYGVKPHELAIVLVVSGYDVSKYPSTDFGVWPQQPTAPDIIVDGIVLEGDYAIVGETQHEFQTDFSSRIGTIVHEMGHLVFGLPDLYDTDYDSAGIDVFGVMGTGNDGLDPLTDTYHGETPVLPSAWTMHKLGWATPQSPLFLTLGAAAKQASAHPQLGRARMFDAARNVCSADEYFLIQYRTNGGYDRGLNAPLDLYTGDFAPGVVIFHIDETVSNNENNDRRLVDVEEANDLPLASWTASEYTLWAQGNATLFDASTSPSSDFNSETGPAQPSDVSIRVGAQSVDDDGEDTVMVTITGPCDNPLTPGTWFP